MTVVWHMGGQWVGNVSKINQFKSSVSKIGQLQSIDTEVDRFLK